MKPHPGFAKKDYPAVAPERFIGTTGRPRVGPELDALLKIAAPCCVCGYWQRKEWLEGEGMCESCRDDEEAQEWE